MPNVNEYWEYVKEQYPDARFDFWYKFGELHFYADGEKEAAGVTTYACIKQGDKFIIKTEEF